MNVKVIFVFTGFGPTESSPVSVTSQTVEFHDKKEAEENINRVQQQFAPYTDMEVKSVRLYSQKPKHGE